MKKLVPKLSDLIDRTNKAILSLPNLPRWGQHVLFWVFLAWVTNSQFSRQFAPISGLTPNPISQYVIWGNHLLLSMISFWAMGYYVVPRFWYGNKPIQAAFCFASYWFVSCWETEQVFNYVANHFAPVPKYVDSRIALYQEISWIGYFTNSAAFWFNWAHNFSYVIIPLLIKAIRDEKSRSKRIFALEQDKLRMELSFLRSQINPHFLFNALNNLYGLMRKSNQVAANTLIDLSDVLRYALYKTNKDFVPLRGELNFLANYLRIEGIRVPASKQVTCEVQGNAADLGIPPMVIVTFIENAFKHGLNSSLAEGFISIAIDIDPVSPALSLRVVNSKGFSYKPSKDGGIGINNIRQRLDLLFGNAYYLHLKNEADTFTVHLYLPLVHLPTNDADYQSVENEVFPFQLH